MIAGVVYCSVMSACYGVLYLRRAHEWTGGAPAGVRRIRTWFRFARRAWFAAPS